MNKLILLGRLTKNPEAVPVSDPTVEVTRFSVACNGYDKKDGASSTLFMDCTAFGKQAEAIRKYFAKGSQILVSGRLEARRYTTKDGRSGIAYALMISEFDFIDKKDVIKQELPEVDEDDLPF